MLSLPSAPKNSAVLYTSGLIINVLSKDSPIFKLLTFNEIKIENNQNSFGGFKKGSYLCTPNANDAERITKSSYSKYATMYAGRAQRSDLIH